MKEVILRKCNSVRYCLRCGRMVKIVMKDLDGYCPNENCRTKLYTLDCSQGVRK